MDSNLPVLMVIRTLRSDNGDVHENVAEKQNSHHFKLFRDYPNSLCYLKEGHRTKDKVRTQMVKFIALLFPLPSKFQICSFHAVAVQ